MLDEHKKNRGGTSPAAGSWGWTDIKQITRALKSHPSLSALQEEFGMLRKSKAGLSRAGNGLESEHQLGSPGKKAGVLC